MTAAADGRAFAVDALLDVLGTLAAKAKLASEPPAPITRPCPECGVEAGQFCRNDSGRITGIHAARRDGENR